MLQISITAFVRSELFLQEYLVAEVDAAGFEAALPSKEAMAVPAPDGRQPPMPPLVIVPSGALESRSARRIDRLTATKRLKS